MPETMKGRVGGDENRVMAAEAAYRAALAGKNPKLIEVTRQTLERVKGNNVADLPEEEQLN